MVMERFDTSTNCNSLWYSWFARHVYHLSSVQPLKMLEKYQRTEKQWSIMW